MDDILGNARGVFEDLLNGHIPVKEGEACQFYGTFCNKEEE